MTSVEEIYLQKRIMQSKEQRPERNGGCKPKTPTKYQERFAGTKDASDEKNGDESLLIRQKSVFTAGKVSHFPLSTSHFFTLYLAL